MASSINASTAGSGGLISTADATGILNIQTAGTTAVIIDASQRAAFVAGTAALPAITTTGDTNTGIFFSAADTIDFAEGGTAVGQFDSSANFKFNSGYGSVATAYGCRAWVNFNGTGTVAIRASGNVTSITDNGTGLYTVNFTTAMPDASYATVGSSIGSTTSADGMILTGTAGGAASTTSAVQVRMAYAPVNTATDITYVNVAVFR
jgi:hypothetical protein